MKTTGLFYWTLTIVSFALAIKFSFSFMEYVLMAGSMMLAYNFFASIKNLRDNLHVLFVIIYIFCSVHIVALLELSSVGFMKDVIYPNEYRAMALWGNRLFIVLFTTLFLLRLFFKKKINKKAAIAPLHHNTNERFDRLFKAITYFVFFLSFVSLALGISSLTRSATVILPFKLNGIIDEIRANTYPFLFAIYVFDCLSKKRKVKTEIGIYFFAYAVLEVFIRVSKSAFVWSFMPAMFVIILMDGIKKKMLVKYVMPILIVGLLLYPIVEQVRVLGGDVSVENMQKAVSESRNKEADEKSSPYIRTFLTGVYYAKLVDDVDPDIYSFDFRRVPLLIVMRGGVEYMTYEIDRFPDDAGQSSGVTGLNDALLWGGYPLCFIVMSLLIMFAFFCDWSNLCRSKPIYKVILFFLLYTLVFGRTITLLVDSSILAVMMGLVIKFICARYYYRVYY